MWFKPEELLKEVSISYAGNDIRKVVQETNVKLTDEEVISLLKQATCKTGISMKEFWRFCDADDIENIYNGSCTENQISAFAKLWGKNIRDVPVGNNIPFPKLGA